VEVLPLLWFTVVVVYHFIPSGPYGTCEAPPSDSVGSGLPRTTYFTEYTTHNCQTVEINPDKEDLCFKFNKLLPCVHTIIICKTVAIILANEGYYICFRN